MELLLDINRILHIVTGVSTLVAGPIAIFFNFKNPRNHRIAGQIFFWSMAYVTFGGAFAILRNPTDTFYQFLFFLAFFTMLGTIRGVRAIQFFKGKNAPTSFDGLIFRTQIGVGAAMIALGGFQFLGKNGGSPVPILLAVFGAACIFSGIGFRKRLSQFAALDRRVWYRMHISDMVGAFTASTTAFVVQTCHFLPPLVQFFGPGFLLAPITYYFLKKLKLGKNDFAEIKNAAA